MYATYLTSNDALYCLVNVNPVPLGGRRLGKLKARHHQLSRQPYGVLHMEFQKFCLHFRLTQEKVYSNEFESVLARKLDRIPAPALLQFGTIFDCTLRDGHTPLRLLE